MSTWADLIAEVRAQIDVDDAQALEWLLDRARVMNAAAGWLLREATIPVGVATQEYALPADCVRTEALTWAARLPALDALQHGSGARVARRKPIYADGVDAQARACWRSGRRSRGR
jgi:hypothetical protein